MFILGKKLKMTQIWKDDSVTPVTVVSVVPNKVSLLRTKEKDGYSAFQLQVGKTKKEFRIRSDAERVDWEKGGTVDVTVFREGDVVNVSSMTKGRGFQGVVKRHGFAGGPKTHGQKNRLRAPGSIGSTAPQRVWPGRRMAGRMGGDRVTIKGLVVLGIDAKEGLLLVRGAVPGARGGLLEVRKARGSK